LLTSKLIIRKMASLTNANIMTLIYENFIPDYRTIADIKNNLLCQVILKSIDYTKFYKAIGKSSILLEDKIPFPKITLLADDNLIITGDYNLRIVNTDNYKTLRTIEQGSYISSIVTLPDNKIAVICDEINLIKILNANEDFECIKIIGSEDQYYSRLSVLSNGDLACKVKINSGPVFIIYHYDIDYNHSKVLYETIDHFNCITSLSNNTIAAGSNNDNLIYIYDANDDYKCIKKLSDHKHWINALLFVPKRNLLISTSNEGKINLWDCSNDYCHFKSLFTQKSIYCLTLLSGGYFASGGLDGIKIYHLTSLRLINHINKENSTNCLKQLKDNRLISTTVNDTVTVWSYAS
jgi:WD40 repeat protein